MVREGVQCVCMATGNPEPTIEFYLPDLNVTVNETDNRYNFYTHTDGHTSTGMIKLREKGERVDNGPAVNVQCSISNMYGRESVQLELQQESECFTEYTNADSCSSRFLTTWLCEVYYEDKCDSQIERIDLVSPLESIKISTSLTNICWRATVPRLVKQLYFLFDQHLKDVKDVKVNVVSAQVSFLPFLAPLLAAL